MRQISLALALLVLSMLACSLPGLSNSTPAPPPPTLVPATLTPAPEPTVLPAPPAAAQPNGFVITDGASNLLFFGADGSLTYTLPIGTDSYLNRFVVHVAGGTSSGMPPVAYFVWRGSDPVIAANSGGVETRLMIQPDFFRMAGAPGTPFFAYTTATYTEAGMVTRMYYGTAATIASAVPVLDLTDPNGYALKPLAFRMEGDTPTGIWYTGCLYGVGGDIVFDPCNRLRLLDLSTGASTDILGDGFNPFSISPDGVWVAFAASGGGQPLQLMNMNTGATYSFAPWPLNDRGSGEGFFSPDGRHVVWMEASGYRMEEPITFQTNIRIGQTDGTALGQHLDDIFDIEAGFPVISATPLGWLDNDSILVQVGGADWTQSAIMRFDLDGAITLLAKGYFIALTYP